MRGLRVVRHADPRAFLDRAEPWLLQREAENNLPLGVAASLVGARPASSPGPAAASAHSAASPSGVEPASPPPLYFATIESGSDVVGCAFRTPPYKLGLTHMPLDAIELLSRDVADVYEEIPAVLAPNPVARAFGDAWSKLRGVSARPGARQRIHILERVVLPARMAPGAMRPARPADIPLVAGWLESFVRESGLSDPGDPLEHAHRLCGRERGNRLLALWMNEEPVSMAGFPARTRHGVRIGYVYTPDEHRRRGYATTLVAQLSGHALDLGFSHCVLYTDLANPTSNKIYREVGYRPLQDVMDVDFE
ncbi:MAG: GNAT family N-acetyltransferase [Gemmatimonadota bacterium]|nr:GNAT family N-acetyltransferase [Gemmatimonadota bacterium]